MKLQTSPVVLICTGLTIVCAAISGVAQVSQNLQSNRATVGRTKALLTVAQHTISASCRPVEAKSFTIGDEIVLDGDGRSPTSCFVNKNGELGFASYLDGKLQILYVFSKKEVSAKRSQIKQESNQ